MATRSMLNIEVVKGDHTFTFSIPAGAHFGQCYDAAFEVLQEVMVMAKGAADKARNEKVEDASQ